MFGKRILILVPHPDDEVVACSAAIGRAQAEGAEIFALYLTHGCIARETLWPWQRKNYEAHVTRRRVEGEKVAALLKIKPVGWFPRPARHLWRELPKAYAEIGTAIATHNIDQLWVPAYEGGNADHDGLNALGSLFARRLGKSKTNSSPLAGQVGWGGDQPGAASNDQSPHLPNSPLPNPPLKGEGIPAVLEFAEYNFFNGTAHSQEFPYPNGTEQKLILTPEESAQKQAALALYASEKQNLNYVKAERECWRPLAAHDYSRPAHPGTLWYARFQWVPFRHPRVDFTKPQDVTDAIVNFLAEKH